MRDWKDIGENRVRWARTSCLKTKDEGSATSDDDDDDDGDDDDDTFIRTIGKR